MLGEFLLIGVCLGSNMNDNACTNSEKKFMEMNPEIGETEKRWDRIYLQPLPDEVKFTGGVIGVATKKELKFDLYKGVYVDFKDEGRGYIGYVYHW